MSDSSLDPVIDPDAPAPEPGPIAADPGPSAADPGPSAADPGPSAAGPVPGMPDRSGSVRRQNRVAAFGTVVLLVALAFGGGLAVGRATAPGAGDGAPASPAATAATGAATPAPVPTAVSSSGAQLPSDGSRLGRADAKVTIEYWADYQCPFCARFAQQVIPQLEPRIADGTVALVHRDYAFIGIESVDAAVAVRCAAGEGKYWAMHDAVYAAQAGENKGAFARTRLAQIAATVGLDAASFGTCLDDRATLVAVLDDTAAGVRAGIGSTPTIEVNGTRFLGVPDMAKLNAAIDAAVAGASPAPLPTREPTPDPWAGTPTDGREAGDAAAPVTVELWMDYQSRDSAAVAKDLEPELRTRIAAGAIRVVQRDLAVLGAESAAAAGMVRCVARQAGPAWLVHDVLAGAGQGADAAIFVPTTLLRFGSSLGLDVKALSACLEDPGVAAAVTAETAAGTALGLTAGPSVVIRVADREAGRFSGALDVKAVLAAIDAAK